MAGIEDLMTASQIAGAIDNIRFDGMITAFEFQPSIGIMAKKFAALADELQDLRVPLTESIVEVMEISILENFMSGGRPTWDDLSPVTVGIRAKQSSGTLILVRSGKLAEAASSLGIWSIGKSTATVRDLPADVWYGKVHQAGYGGSQFSGGNWFKKYQSAARKAVGPDEDQKTVDELAYKMFDKRLNSHGPAPRGASPIPARPFIMFQDEDIDAIQNIFAKWVEKKVEEVLTL
jgi:phage gpG-like protein